MLGSGQDWKPPVQYPHSQLSLLTEFQYYLGCQLDLAKNYFLASLTIRSDCVRGSQTTLWGFQLTCALLPLPTSTSFQSGIHMWWLELQQLPWQPWGRNPVLIIAQMREPSFWWRHGAATGALFWLSPDSPLHRKINPPIYLNASIVNLCYSANY